MSGAFWSTNENPKDGQYMASSSFSIANISLLLMKSSQLADPRLGMLSLI